MYDVKVSVVMPVYNAEEFLIETLDSLIKQTLQEIEIICVDDMSTDRSLSILQEYALNDTRVKVFKSPQKTLGPGAARNHGLKKASGEFIYFADADDLFDPNMLEESYNKARSTEVDIVLFDSVSFDTQTGEVTGGQNRFLIQRFLPEKEVFKLGDIENHQFSITCGVSWICLYRHVFLIENELCFIENVLNEDLVFSYLSLAVAKRITVLKRFFVKYRQGNPISVSSTRDKWPDCGYNAFSLLKQELERRNIYTLFQRTFANCALKSVLSDLDMTCDPDAFHKIYMIGKQKCIPEFGIDVLKDSEIISEDYRIKRDFIIHSSPEEYLIRLKGYWRIRNRKAYIGKIRDIPFEKNEPIAIYGAGAKGREWFSFLFNRSYRIVKWVDKNAHAIGFPISEPDSLKEEQIKMVIVAIEDEEVFEQVGVYLYSMGFTKESIYWPFEHKS